MPHLDFLTHLPLLRIQEELLPFGAGQLYRMPFTHYDEISLGAFSEQQKRMKRRSLCYFPSQFLCRKRGLSAGSMRYRA